MAEGDASSAAGAGGHQGMVEVRVDRGHGLGNDVGWKLRRCGSCAVHSDATAASVLQWCGAPAWLSHTSVRLVLISPFIQCAPHTDCELHLGA